MSLRSLSALSLSLLSHTHSLTLSTTHCNTLSTTPCITLQRTVTNCNTLHATYCNNALSATYCNILQHAATGQCCSTRPSREFTHSQCGASATPEARLCAWWFHDNVRSSIKGHWTAGFEQGSVCVSAYVCVCVSLWVYVCVCTVVPWQCQIGY